MRLIQIRDNNVNQLQNLADEARRDGYNFVQRTIDQWQDGTNDFSKVGEVLYALIENDDVVSIGGINNDPYTNESNIGRIRHVYTKQNYRRRGYSRIILLTILENYAKYYNKIRLSTNNPIAAKLYESLGFESVDEVKATHIYIVKNK